MNAKGKRNSALTGSRSKWPSGVRLLKLSRRSCQSVLGETSTNPCTNPCGADNPS